MSCKSCKSCRDTTTDQLQRRNFCVLTKWNRFCFSFFFCYNNLKKTSSVLTSALNEFPGPALVCGCAEAIRSHRLWSALWDLNASHLEESERRHPIIEYFHPLCRNDINTLTCCIYDVTLDSIKGPQSLKLPEREVFPHPTTRGQKTSFGLSSFAVIKVE